MGLNDFSKIIPVYTKYSYVLIGRWCRILLRIVMKNLEKVGGARGVMVIVVGNGHSNSSSNPGRDLLHFR